MHQLCWRWAFWGAGREHPLSCRAICTCWALREHQRAAWPRACQALGALGEAGEVAASPEVGGGWAGRRVGGDDRERQRDCRVILPWGGPWGEQMHLGPALPPAELSSLALWAWEGAGSTFWKSFHSSWRITPNTQSHQGKATGAGGPDSLCDGVSPTLPRASVSPSGRRGCPLFCRIVVSAKWASPCDVVCHGAQSFLGVGSVAVDRAVSVELAWGFRPQESLRTRRRNRFYFKFCFRAFS